MTTLLAIMIGSLYGAAIYMLLRRSIVKLIIGFSLLAHATTLLIFTVGRVTREYPAIIRDGHTVLTEPYADPVPQALILTAIVIGFGIQAFAILLIKRVYAAVGTDDSDQLRSTDTLRYEEEKR